MRLVIRDESESIADWLADYIVRRVASKQQSNNKPFILGLSSDPIVENTCEHIVKRFRNGEISFRNIVVVCLEEYCDLPISNQNSTHWKVWHWLLKHVDCPRENVYILDGNAPDMSLECERFETALRHVGQIDLVLAGAAANGSILGNEPGSSLAARTRQKRLAHETRLNLVPKFNSTNASDATLSIVPTSKLTAGTRDLSEAEELVVVYRGVHDASALRSSVRGTIHHMCPASLLQMHKNALLVCDQDATHELSVGLVKYFSGLQSAAHLEECQSAGVSLVNVDQDS